MAVVCGIGGILRTDGQPIPEEWLDAIDARIAWRGPDGHGRFRDRVEVADENAPGGKRIVEVGFVHRRLSIIDHKDGGQPMVSERGRNDSEGLVAVVFNGCIYNHRELRKELEAKGHKFVTDHSDTEVLIHGWREWKAELVTHLSGMFAFALWERNTATLALARDPFGKKPLYVLLTDTEDETVAGKRSPQVFASTPAALWNIPLGVSQSEHWNVGRLATNMLQHGYLNRTNLWLGSHGALFGHMAPGYLARTQVDRIERGCHDGPEVWRERVVGEIEPLIEAAVLRRLDADVPLGCFLSGGVDSSLVAHFAQKQSGGLRTFSVRMPDLKYDESSFAESVARHLKTDHITLDVEVKPANDLIELVAMLGQPFGDSSILPTYWVSKAARKHVKVALSGDGGDELFLGYERYQVAGLLASKWRWLRHLPTDVLYRLHPKSPLHKLARLVAMARDFPVMGLLALECMFSQQDLRDLLGSSATEPTRWADGGDAIAALRQMDIDEYLPNDLLRKVDTASMAAGLEVRCPFLDRDLARAALSMPIEQLMPRGQRKGLLRNIARKYLPKEIVDRPKMGFAIPIGEWFRDDDLPHKGSGMKTLLLDHLNSAEPFGPIQLNRKAVQRYIDEHMAGKRDHGQKLFTLLTLSIWARQAAKRKPVPDSRGD